MDHHLTLFSPLSALFWIRTWFKNCFSLILNKCKISVKLFELKLKICTLITYWLWWWCTEAKPQKVSDYGPNLFVWKVLNTIYFYHFSYLFIYFPRIYIFNSGRNWSLPDLLSETPIYLLFHHAGDAQQYFQRAIMHTNNATCSSTHKARTKCY